MVLEHGPVPFPTLSVVAPVGCSRNFKSFRCHLLLLTQILSFSPVCSTLLVVLSRTLIRTLAGWNRFLHISSQETKGLSVVSWGLKSLDTWACSVRSLSYMIECPVLCLLSLRENSISPEGAQALAQALRANNTLKHLEYVVGSGGMEVKGRWASSLTQLTIMMG